MRDHVGKEILAKQGPDIGVAGAQDLEHRAMHDKYPHAAVREAATGVLQFLTR